MNEPRLVFAQQITFLGQFGKTSCIADGKHNSLQLAVIWSILITENYQLKIILIIYLLS